MGRHVALLQQLSAATLMDRNAPPRLRQATAPLRPQSPSCQASRISGLCSSTIFGFLTTGWTDPDLTSGIRSAACTACGRWALTRRVIRSALTFRNGRLRVPRRCGTDVAARRETPASGHADPRHCGDGGYGRLAGADDHPPLDGLNFFRQAALWGVLA